MLTKLATFRGVSSTGEPLNRIFRPGDSIEKLAGTMMPEIQQWLATYVPDSNKVAVLVNALGASEYWGQNVNGDVFYEDALVHDCRNHPGSQHPYDDFTGKILPAYGYRTFLDALPFVHHRNKDPNRAFGKVVLSVWNPKMHRVELIILLDKQRALEQGAQHVIDKILAGEFPDVSMGCRVPYDVCTICGHKSKTRADYCNCIRYIGMGKILDDGRRIGVINLHPRFFDISFVFIGADKTAKVMCKLASSDLWVPQSILEAEQLYGVSSDDNGLVKAASMVIPPNLYMKRDLNEDNAQGILEDALSFSPTLRLIGKITGLRPSSPISRIDTQENEGKRAIADGALPTNAFVNESDEYKSAAQISEIEHYGSMKRVWDAAEKMKIGPPPKPNRKEFPFTGTIDFRGLMIHVENKPGSVREGPGWKTNMKLAYGEFMGTRGVDKDKVDVYVGPYRMAPNVYIVHQNHVKGPKKDKYDEDKVMLGFESGEQAKEAYLAHYNSPKFFRSITTMAFPLFKRAIMTKEVHGEKVASQLTGVLEKVAVDMKLEDLFQTPETRRRQRMWKDEVTGKETKVSGSGFESLDKAKTASVHKTASPLSPSDLLKVSNDPKTASHLKWADIVKEIGPDKAVGRVSPLLSQSEPTLPRDLLNEMGSKGMESALATPSLMGMVLKPEEFQRIALSCMGKGDLADRMDDAGAVFKPEDQEACPCKSLSPGDMHSGLMQKLMPFLKDKSYFGPPVRHRIIRITISQSPPEQSSKEVESPLLSKVAAAYTWYRREQMKLAGDAMTVVPNIPALHAGIYGLDESDLFGKMAFPVSVSPNMELNLPSINRKTLAVILGAVPLTLMYSAHLRGKRQHGEDLGMMENLIADHPWLATIGTSAGLKKIMDTPQAQQAVEELASAGGRIWRGGPTPIPV